MQYKVENNTWYLPEGEFCIRNIAISYKMKLIPVSRAQLLYWGDFATYWRWLIIVVLWQGDIFIVTSTHTAVYGGCGGMQ